MNVLSLFAGIGGIELGLERAGMTTVGQVEIDPYCTRVLANHWPEVARHDDVSTTPKWWSSKPRPPVDVVCGGFPCQPFSLAGRQLGTADERWMWPAFRDVVRAVRPRYVLVENVAALVRDTRAFGTVLADLHHLGFDAEWATVRASDHGAPHNRQRVFIVAHPAGVDGQARVGMESHRSGNTLLAVRGIPGLPVHERRRSADQWMEREPRVDRLVDGVPHRMDRLRTAGNAVVPVVAEHFGRLIMANERKLVAA